jgi:hypothetical protein
MRYGTQADGAKNSAIFLAARLGVRQKYLSLHKKQVLIRYINERSVEKRATRNNGFGSSTTDKIPHFLKGQYYVQGKGLYLGNCFHGGIAACRQ